MGKRVYIKEKEDLMNINWQAMYNFDRTDSWRSVCRMSHSRSLNSGQVHDVAPALLIILKVRFILELWCSASVQDWFSIRSQYMKEFSEHRDFLLCTMGLFSPLCKGHTYENTDFYLLSKFTMSIACFNVFSGWVTTTIHWWCPQYASRLSTIQHVNGIRQELLNRPPLEVNLRKRKLKSRSFVLFSKSL